MIKIKHFKEQEDPEIVDLKQELLRIDQDIADLKIRQLETNDPDEKKDIKQQIEDLKNDKESIKNDIDNIKGE